VETRLRGVATGHSELEKNYGRKIEGRFEHKKIQFGHNRTEKVTGVQGEETDGTWVMELVKHIWVLEIRGG